jgi:ribokinase
MGAAPALVCVGNLTIDEAVHGGDRSEPAIGGDAAYAALAARLFLDDVTMLAPVGNDFPAWILDSLRARGVRADDLPMRDVPTVRNIVTYHADGSRTWDMLSSEADFDALSVYPDDVTAAVLSADGMMLSAMSLESQLVLTPWLRERTGAALYLDLQEDYLEGNLEALFGIIALCDVFLPSEVEAVALAGTTDLAAAARLFQALGPQVVVIKRAENGSLVLDGDTLTEVPADTVVAVDSTGAGDSFCGAFAAMHLLTGDAVAAARAASGAARIAIGAFGIMGLLDAVGSKRPAEVAS